LPFTLSHTAAAIPLARRGLVFSALVVGSMSPDFSYFVFQTTAFRFSHTLPGIFFFCVPISLALLWLFHSLLKYPLLSLLPEAHCKRLIPVAQGFRFGPLPHFAVLAFSIALGALTHLVWDAFTHEGEWGTMYLAFLRKPIWQSGVPDPFKFCDLLQHASTIWGTAFLIFWYRRWLHQQPATVPSSTIADSTTQIPVQLSAKGRKQLLCTFVAITLILAIAFNYNTKLLFHSYADLQAFLRVTVLLAVPLLLAQLCLYSLMWHLIAARQFTCNGQSGSGEAAADQTGAGRMTKKPRDGTQHSTGEYSMRFADGTHTQPAEMKRPSGEQRSAGEYSMRGPG
jgi:hypothetical protein